MPFCNTYPSTQTHIETGATLVGHNAVTSPKDALPHVRTSVHGFTQPRYS